VPDEVAKESRLTPDELRAIADFLRQRVQPRGRGAEGGVIIGFDAPDHDELARAGLDVEGYRQILDAPWWDEMVCDIVETPEICDPDDPPERILEYARDVVSEYIAKRVTL
jgi:hypothetical protein